MTTPDNLSLEIVGDLDAAVQRALPALADLLVSIVRRRAARRNVARRILARCREWAAKRGIQLPPR
jgi:hypothetical protein